MKLSIEELVAMATEFEWPYYVDDHYRVTISKRGDDQWAVLDGDMCWTRNGEWVHEPLPSSRSEAFLKQARYTLEGALAAAQAAQADLDDRVNRARRSIMP